MSKPKKTFRCGGVNLSVWENQRKVDNRTFSVESVTLTRRFKNGEGEWDSSSSFGKNDIPKIRVVCQKAYEYMNSGESEEESEAQ